VLLGTAAIVSFMPAHDRNSFAANLLPALGYVMNWHLILGDQPYFDPTTRPPLLQHLWSLAVEEQFYILWPLAFMGGMLLLGRWGLRIATFGLAICSSLLMVALYQAGGDVSRIYFGTDTRASGLLLGAGLALVWQPWRKPRGQRRAVGLGLDLLGFAALAALIYAYATVFEQHPQLYQGGFAAVALATAAVIVATTHPQASWLPRLLELAPLRWLGTRSYGIYLWHWPIFMVTRPYIDITLDIPAWLFLALRIGVVLVLAALSYRFVEQPIREGALDRIFGPRPQTAPEPVVALRRSQPSLPVRALLEDQ
jgi:peptidoglycan/LPS O-acetylase OafA/YrhL